MNKNNKEDKDKMYRIFKQWADEALEREAYPVLAISIKDVNGGKECVLHRTDQLIEAWKIKVLLYNLAESL